MEIPSPVSERLPASGPNGSCNELVKGIIHSQLGKARPELAKKVISLGNEEDGVLDAIDMEKMLKKYAFPSEEPVEIEKAFEGIYNGKMSLAVFNKLASDFPNIQGSVSILVFKDHLKELHKLNPNNYPTEGMEIIKSSLSRFKKPFTLQKETDDFYIFDLAINETKDVENLGKITSIATIEPIVFFKNSSPTNRFFKIPEAVIKKVENKITDDADERLAFIVELREGRMSLEAAVDRKD